MHFGRENSQVKMTDTCSHTETSKTVNHIQFSDKELAVKMSSPTKHKTLGYSTRKKQSFHVSLCYSNNNFCHFFLISSIEEKCNLISHSQISYRTHEYCSNSWLVSPCFRYSERNHSRASIGGSGYVHSH